MSVPTLKWEINFTGTTWTDITAYVEAGQGWQIDRGRNHELGRADVGVHNLVLRDDGRFDPANTTGPYGANVKPYRALRVTHPTTGLSLYTGYVERWTQGWSKHGRYATVSLTCVDALAVLANTPLDGQYETEVLTDGPLAYYRLDETNKDDPQVYDSPISPQPVPASFFSHTGGGRAYFTPTPSLSAQLNGKASTAVIRGGTSAIAGDDNPSMGFGAGAVIALPANAPRGRTGEAWIRLTNVGTSGSQSVIVRGARDLDEAIQLEVGVQWTGGRAYPYVYNQTRVASSNLTVQSPAPLTQDTWYYLAWRFLDHTVFGDNTSSHDADYTAELYVNGTLTATGRKISDAGFPFGGSTGISAPTLIGSGRGTSAVTPYRISSDPDSTAQEFPGFLDEIALYNALSPERISAHYTAGIIARSYPVAATGAYINAVLDRVGWPTALRSIAAGTVLIANSGNLGAVSALEHLLTIADTERGVLFADGDGRITLQDTSARSTFTATAQFGENPGELPYEGDIQIELAIDEVRNDWSIAVLQGGNTVGVARSIDPTSVQPPPVGFFRRATSQALPFALTSDAEAVADLMIALYAQPHRRCPKVTFQLAGRTSTFVNTILGLNIGTGVTVHRRTPDGVASSLDCWIEAVQHTGGLDAHDVTFLLSPAAVQSSSPATGHGYTAGYLAGY